MNLNVGIMLLTQVVTGWGTYKTEKKTAVHSKSRNTRCKLCLYASYRSIKRYRLVLKTVCARSTGLIVDAILSARLIGSHGYQVLPSLHFPSLGLWVQSFPSPSYRSTDTLSTEPGSSHDLWVRIENIIYRYIYSIISVRGRIWDAEGWNTPSLKHPLQWMLYSYKRLKL